MRQDRLHTREQRCGVEGEDCADALSPRSSNAQAQPRFAKGKTSAGALCWAALLPTARTYGWDSHKRLLCNCRHVLAIVLNLVDGAGFCCDQQGILGALLQNDIGPATGRRCEAHDN